MESNKANLGLDKELHKDAKIAIISAKFNESIVDDLRVEAKNILLQQGLKEDNIQIFFVPGAYEIPLMCKVIAELAEHDGIIVLGCIIKGETHHFTQVADACSEGVLNVSVTHKLPIGYGVLAVDNISQALSRSTRNEENKGRDAALATLMMINNLKKF